MVCIYCSGDTNVVNSRLQKRSNSVWRRRQCLSCGNVFSTVEAADLASALRMELTEGKLVPFKRAMLFASIYEACKHLKSPAETADALTDTVITLLLKDKTVVIGREQLVKTVQQVLQRYNKASAVQYTAYHPL